MLSNTVELTIRNNQRQCSWQEAITLLKMSMNNANQAIDIAEQLAILFPDALLHTQFKEPRDYHSFFQLLHQLQQHKVLITCANAATKYFPNDAQSYFILSMANRLLRNEDASFNALLTATELMPSHIQWRQMLGVFYKERGEKEKALACFNGCIAQQADFMEAYWQRSNFIPILSVSELNLLTTVVQTTEKTASIENNKIFAAYSLFRHYDEINQPDLAFEFLTLGAQLKRKQLSFDINKEVTEHQLIAENFNDDLLNKQSTLVSPQKDGCIFICGLPRSGTTLIEHILSVHNNITAGDELFSLAQATQQVTTKKQGLKPFPTWAEQLSLDEWQAIGKGYIELTQPLRKTKYLTDKMPLNYKAIGLIHLALPNAKIVYCQREPMDILFGCFKQLLGQGNAYTYQLDEMAEMIIAHHKLMHYWQYLLPDKIFTLRYEDLVNNQEKAIKNVLNFLELPWDDTCLTFYQSKRTVHTISNLQIRQPISTNNIARWKKYESYLAPYYQKFSSHNIPCN